jgi:hypothetical protein
MFAVVKSLIAAVHQSIIIGKTGISEIEADHKV